MKCDLLLVHPGWLLPLAVCRVDFAVIYSFLERIRLAEPAIWQVEELANLIAEINNRKHLK